MKVITTNVSKKFKYKIEELGRIAEPGEIFEVSEDRFKVLNGGNKYRGVFVQKYNEPIIVEKTTVQEEKPVEKKPARKGGRKKKVQVEENA